MKFNVMESWSGWLGSAILAAVVVGSAAASPSIAREETATKESTNTKEQAAAKEPNASSEQKSDTTAAPRSQELFKQFEALVLEYYPKAKLKKSGEALHVEYKTKIYANPATNRNELGPLWGGLVADLELKPGEYQGIEKMPQNLNQYSFYIVMLDAPYSKNADQHLYTRLMYPFDTPPEFLKRYKLLVGEFDKYVKTQ